MRKLLRGMVGVCNYIDDILVHSRTWEDHLHTLAELFQRIREANLTVRPSKCFIAQEQVEFLGHVVGRGLVAKTKKQVRSFLGTTNYYRNFIPNYSAIAVPLTDKLKKNEPIQVRWEQSEENAFQALKSKLNNSPILRLPDLSKTFVLRTDASQYGLGAVLL